MGVLLMKALPTAIEGRILRLAVVSVLGWPINRCDSREMAPLEYMPAATGNSAATVSTPTLLNPLSRPVAGASRRVMATVMAPTKTTQVGSLSHAMTANIATSRQSVNQACRGILGRANYTAGAND